MILLHRLRGNFLVLPEITPDLLEDHFHLILTIQEDVFKPSHQFLVLFRAHQDDLHLFLREVQSIHEVEHSDLSPQLFGFSQFLSGKLRKPP
ncbi:hypothetical protein ES703_116104 [subsurface metagenome]